MFNLTLYETTFQRDKLSTINLPEHEASKIHIPASQRTLFQDKSLVMFSQPPFLHFTGFLPGFRSQFPVAVPSRFPIPVSDPGPIPVLIHILSTTLIPLFLQFSLPQRHQISSTTLLIIVCVTFRSTNYRFILTLPKRLFVLFLVSLPTPKQ